MNRFEVAMAFAEAHGPFVLGDLRRAHPDFHAPASTLGKMVKQGYLKTEIIRIEGRAPCRLYSLASDDITLTAAEDTAVSGTCGAQQPVGAAHSPFVRDCCNLHDAGVRE